MSARTGRFCSSRHLEEGGRKDSCGSNKVEEPNRSAWKTPASVAAAPHQQPNLRNPVSQGRLLETGVHDWGQQQHPWMMSTSTNTSTISLFFPPTMILHQQKKYVSFRLSHLQHLCCFKKKLTSLALILQPPRPGGVDSGARASISPLPLPLTSSEEEHR